MASPLINLVPLPLKFGSYSSDALSAELQTSEHEYLAACALGVYPATAQLDHFAAHFKHNEYQAVRGDVPLGTIAFANRDVASTTRQQSAQGLAPWVGDLNDTQAILCEMAERGLQPDLSARLRLAKYLPRTRNPMTLMPLVGGRKLELNLTRLSGGRSILELVLWCVRLPKHAFDDACNLTGLPHWVTLATEIPEAADVTSEHDVFINPGDSWGLRLRAIFAQAYNNADASFSEAHLNAVAGRLRLDDREIYPNVGQRELRLGQLYAQCMQDFDHGRDPRLVLPDKSYLRHVLQSQLSVGAKDLHLTHYGTVQRVHSADGVRAV